MPDYVRVKHAETKHHYTVSRAKAMTDPNARYYCQSHYTQSHY